MTSTPTFSSLRSLWAVLGAVFWVGSALAGDTNPDALLTQYQQAASQKADRARGQKFFNASAANDLSCASCHGASPMQAGKHASTGKTIAPLAPLVNPDRFSDSAKVEKWFRRNCKDVLSRECTALEKADVVSYVKELK
ncbi:MAG: Cytochrome c-type protein precursor [Pseudomonadota bacterium]|jgi:cytochrome c